MFIFAFVAYTFGVIIFFLLILHCNQNKAAHPIVLIVFVSTTILHFNSYLVSQRKLCLLHILDSIILWIRAYSTASKNSGGSEVHGRENRHCLREYLNHLEQAGGRKLLSRTLSVRAQMNP